MAMEQKSMQYIAEKIWSKFQDLFGEKSICGEYAVSYRVIYF